MCHTLVSPGVGWSPACQVGVAWPVFPQVDEMAFQVGELALQVGIARPAFRPTGELVFQVGKRVVSLSPSWRSAGQYTANRGILVVAPSYYTALNVY
jgi:hypothetical protein